MDGTSDASPSSKLHTKLRLWEFPDCYIFEPIDGLADLYLSVSRVSGTMNLVEELPSRGSSANPKVQTIYGVIGVLKLAVGSYFLVITDRDCVGSHLGHAVFKVTGLKVLPCNNALSTSSADQKKMEKEFSELLDAAERTIGLHFSYDVNLTLSTQKLHDLGDDYKSLPLWRQVCFFHFLFQSLVTDQRPYLYPPFVIIRRTKISVEQLLVRTSDREQTRNDARHMLLSLLWAGLCIGITYFVRANGRTFTNRPRFFQSRH